MGGLLGAGIVASRVGAFGPLIHPFLLAVSDALGQSVDQSRRALVPRSTTADFSAFDSLMLTPNRKICAGPAGGCLRHAASSSSCTGGKGSLPEMGLASGSCKGRGTSKMLLVLLATTFAGPVARALRLLVTCPHMRAPAWRRRQRRAAAACCCQHLPPHTVFNEPCILLLFLN